MERIKTDAFYWRTTQWLCLLLLLTSCAPSAPALKQTLDAAATLVASGEYTAAEQRYQQALSDFPTASQPALELAQLYHVWQRPEESLAALQQAQQRGAPEATTQPLIINALAQNQAWEDVQTEAQGWLTRAPEDTEILARLTQAQLEIGDCAAATESALRWQQTTTNTAAILTWSMLTGADAICQYRNDLCLCSDNCALHRGYISLRKGDWAMAACLLEQAVAATPNSADAHAWLAEALARTDRPQPAAQHFEQATQLAPDAPLAWLLWGTHQLNWGDAEAARKSLLRAQSLDPANPAPCLAMAEVKAYTGHYDEIGIWTTAALERAPWDSDVWQAVARLYLERRLIQGRFPMQIAKQAVDLAPTDAAAQMLVGWAYLNQGDATHALFELDGAIHLDATLAQAHHLRGRALQATGEITAAQAAFIRAADLGYGEWVNEWSE